MTKFSSGLLQQCQSITEIMRNSPCCKIFLDPVDPIEDELPDYYDIVKNPQDLNTIKQRITSGYYNTCQEWEEAMDLVFDNAILFYEPESIEAVMAESMKNKFHKLCKLLVHSQEEWSKEIKNIYDKINNLMKNPPSVLKELHEKDFSGPTTRDDMKKLCKAVTSITNHSDILEMMQLLATFHVKVDYTKKENHFQLLKMPPDAVQALMLFVQNKFRSENREYPS
ncbi:Bromodomain containing protein [Tritrichomonas foetus]|uniref:Bromodomain containing protein n=1 Tax=Tritrichomonas foetus TaxID=1144522 RepID=A0A1J4JBQ6_9EUKA|nr:Bromodomain containing protein [Tritrichomonas foetus]|eukprot:OHS96626.1 Bromodomain containing protein [Tritrichomonas foetus]